MTTNESNASEAAIEHPLLTRLRAWTQRCLVWGYAHWVIVGVIAFLVTVLGVIVSNTAASGGLSENKLAALGQGLMVLGGICFSVFMALFGWELRSDGLRERQLRRRYEPMINAVLGSRSLSEVRHICIVYPGFGRGGDAEIDLRDVSAPSNLSAEVAEMTSKSRGEAVVFLARRDQLLVHDLLRALAIAGSKADISYVDDTKLASVLLDQNAKNNGYNYENNVLEISPASDSPTGSRPVTHIVSIGLRSSYLSVAVLQHLGVEAQVKKRPVSIRQAGHEETTGGDGLAAIAVCEFPASKVSVTVIGGAHSIGTARLGDLVMLRAPAELRASSFVSEVQAKRLRSYLAVFQAPRENERDVEDGWPSQTLRRLDRTDGSKSLKDLLAQPPKSGTSVAPGAPTSKTVG